MKKLIVKVIPQEPNLPYYIGCSRVEVEGENWYKTPFVKEATYVEEDGRSLIEDLGRQWLDSWHKEADDSDEGYHYTATFEVVEVEE